MDDFRDGCLSFLIGAVIVIGIVAGLVFGIGGLAWHADHVTCLRVSEATGNPTRMVGNMFGGECYIQVNNRWIPLERYRGVDNGD